MLLKAYGLTLINGALQLFTNSQHLNTGPKVRANSLGHAESPATTIDVTSVLPDGLEAFLEEVNRFAHLDLVNGCVVVASPEVLNRSDLGSDLLELDVVFVIIALVVLGLSIAQGCLAIGTS